MTQKQIVNRWLKGSEDAWDTAEKLMAAKNLTILFFIHLALEKIIKAVFIKRTIPSHP